MLEIQAFHLDILFGIFTLVNLMGAAIEYFKLSGDGRRFIHTLIFGAVIYLLVRSTYSME